MKLVLSMPMFLCVTTYLFTVLKVGVLRLYMCMVGHKINIEYAVYTAWLIKLIKNPADIFGYPDLTEPLQHYWHQIQL